MEATRPWVASVLLAIGLCLPLLAHADDPCEDAKVLVRKAIVTGAPYGTESIGLGEARTVSRIRHHSGDAVLLQWSYGAGGRIECSYVAYRPKGGSYRHFPVLSAAGYARIDDIDGDGLDELVLLLGQPWGMECSDSMSSIPHRIQIMSLDMATGVLVEVTRTFGGHVRIFLIDMKKKYNSSTQATGGGLTPECEAQWVQLLKETHETAWFVLLVATSALAVVTFALGFARSSSWRWLGRIVGAIAFFATTAAAIYSLGDLGWHVVGFSDFWSALQIVTGFRFNSVAAELVSTGVSAYAGWTLLKG